MCVQFAGTVFALNEAGQAVIIDADGADRDEIIDAAAECPMEAISVSDAASGEELFPGFRARRAAVAEPPWARRQGETTRGEQPATTASAPEV